MVPGAVPAPLWGRVYHPTDSVWYHAAETAAGAIERKFLNIIDKLTSAGSYSPVPGVVVGKGLPSDWFCLVPRCRDGSWSR